VLRGALRIFFVDVAKNLLNPVLVRDRFVEPELELGDAPQVQTRADLAAEEAGRACERARRLLARIGVAEACVEHAGQLQIRSDLHARQRDESNARIVHLAAGENFAQLVAYLVADPVWPVSLRHTQNLGRR
jgi:hypothetical protein